MASPPVSASASSPTARVAPLHDVLLHYAVEPAPPRPEAPPPPVPHIRQRFSWDCGLACAEMVILAVRLRQAAATASAVGASPLPPESPPPPPGPAIAGALRSLAGTRSVWSIDVAHALAAFPGAPPVRPTLYTVRAGVRPDYAGERFYSRHLAADEGRVVGRFGAAATAGVGVVLGHLRRDVLAAAVARGVLCVVLVDKRLMRCSECSRGWADGGGGGGLVGRLVGRVFGGGGGGAEAEQGETAGVMGGVLSVGGVGGGGDEGAVPAAAAVTPTSVTSGMGIWGGFLGHYILLCGYDAAIDEFEMRDPASRREACWIKGDVLESARRAFGTDEDIIAIAPAVLPSTSAEPALPATQPLQACQEQDGVPRSPASTVFTSTVKTSEP